MWVNNCRWKKGSKQIFYTAGRGGSTLPHKRALLCLVTLKIGNAEISKKGLFFETRKHYGTSLHTPLSHTASWWQQGKTSVRTAQSAQRCPTHEHCGLAAVGKRNSVPFGHPEIFLGLQLVAIIHQRLRNLTVAKFHPAIRGAAYELNIMARVSTSRLAPKERCLQGKLKSRQLPSASRCHVWPHETATLTKLYA